MKKGYIYVIKNKVDSKVYIGLTSNNVKDRWLRHKRDYLKKNGKHPKLHKAFNEYGIRKFYICKLEKVEISKINEREKFWISEFDSFYTGLNCTKGGDWKIPESIKKQMNETNWIKKLFNWINTL